MDEHRYLMEQEIGRRLGFNEIVHHKDGNSRNNDLKNLEIIKRSKHSHKFMLGRQHSLGYTWESHVFKNGKYWCNNCKQYLIKDKFWPAKDRKHGVRTFCKVCELKRIKERKILNKK